METQRVPTDQSFSALPTGTVLDRYRIDQVIAAGGFGITYLCHHTTLGKPYALKEHFPRQLAYREGTTSNVRSTDPGTFTWALDRFIQEGRSLATCSHPNVVNVADVFEANSTAYMVLAYEQGQSLKSWLEELKRPLNQAEVDKVLAPLLDALEYVHSKGLLHRDIAPDNIIIRPDETPCLIDFGAARQAVAERSQIMSAVVKSGFSPPEQYTRTGKAQGPWSDIYALAATLYRAISGVSPQESPERQIDDELRPLAEILEDPARYRASFLQAIDQALALRYTDRPQTIAAWRPHLLGTREVATTFNPANTRHAAALAPQKDSAPQSANTPSNRRGPALIAAAIALVAVAIGGLWALNRPAVSPPLAASVAERPAAAASQSASQSAALPPTAPQSSSPPVAPPASSPPSAATPADSPRQAQLADERRRQDKAAEDAAAESARRNAETQRVAAAEQAKRQADEQRAAEDSKRRANAEAETQRLAVEAEARRRADEERRAAAEAERQRAEDATRQASVAKPAESTPQPPTAPPTLTPAAPPPPDVSQPEFARTMQSELRRVGCYFGAVDGDWGVGSQKAFDEFVKFAKLDRAGKPEAVHLMAIQAKSARVCPAPVVTCDPDERLVNGQCVAKPKPVPPKQRETKPASSSNNSQPKPQYQPPKPQANCGSYIACTRLYRPGHGDIHCQRPPGC